MKGGIIIPNKDFITTLLNIAPSDVSKCDIRTVGNSVFYDVTLVRKPMCCPICGGRMIGHGHKLKKSSTPHYEIMQVLSTTLRTATSAKNAVQLRLKRILLHLKVLIRRISFFRAQ